MNARSAFWLLSLVFLIAPAAQAAEEEIAVLNLDRVLRPNFAGSWEKDFVRSDNWETELQRTINQMQEAAERRRRQQSGDGRRRRIATGPTSSGGGGGSSSNAPSLVPRSTRTNLFDLAQLAEYITRNTLVDIIQNEHEIRIIREGEADLVCAVDVGVMTSFSSDVGVEICGWDRSQLLFEVSLPGSLTVQHRYSVSADTQSLNVLTSVAYRDSTPFDLIQVFSKYDAPPDSLNCRRTITRGNICNQPNR